MYEKRCVYCGKVITKLSKEHVIQNALGGKYESEDICCGECNNYVSKYIDKNFTEIFNPIIAEIKNLYKTNNKKSNPIYTGNIEYKGKIYKAKFKAGRVVSCSELSKKYKCDIKKLNVSILSKNFELENEAFKNGLCKIAFNFAIDKGISSDNLKKGLNIDKEGEKIKKISFNYPVVPFMPLNEVDNYIELKTSMILYHNLILFSYSNILCCYIDLFNTFQYYVILSQDFYSEKDIYESYIQFVQNMDRKMPEISISSISDILIYADQYNIEPTMDLDELKKRIKISIEKESIVKNMVDIISEKIQGYANYCIDNRVLSADKIESIQMYFDEDDRLIEDNFRKLTIYKDDKGNTKTVFYPEQITRIIDGKKTNEKITKYCHQKMYRLENFNKENI